MGLCKCPKRKVTNLFCYVHRVNVCEYCLVANHPKCVVQSYLNWLKDSDFDNCCTLSGREFESVDTVRLLCYCVFDWDALNKHFKSLPATTAPAGYKCPNCSAGVFPAENQAGPVADALREKLKTASWARVGLGLPLIPEGDEESDNNNSDSLSKTWDAPESFNPINNRIASPLSTSTPVSKELPSVISITESEVTNREKLKRQLDFPAQRETAVSLTDGDVDESENKYARRKPVGFIGKLMKAHEIHPKYKEDSDITKNTLIVLLVIVVGIFAVLYFLTKVGRNRADSDPFLDPLNNPNIHNADINVETD